MYPYIHIIIPSYTLMALIGGFITICFLFSRLDRFKIDFVSFLKMFAACLVGGIIGSKVVFALTQIENLVANFSFQNLLLLIPTSGFVFYGGLLGVIFTLLFITRKDKQYRKDVFRLATPGMPLFHAFGRIGCFLSGCCYGKALSSPLVIGPLEITNIPIQLFEVLAEFILFIILTILDKKKDEIDLLRIYLISYASIRFFDEFFRGDEIRGIYFGLSTSQWISLIILAFYLCKFIRAKNTAKKVNIDNSMPN